MEVAYGRCRVNDNTSEHKRRTKTAVEARDPDYEQEFKDLLETGG
jgi:hypothetical protein